MELTVASIVAFVTLILGQITKKLNWVDKKYIPIQTFLIGIISGLICFFTEVETNFVTSMITCILASASASGIYDLATIKKDQFGLTEEEL